MPWKENMLYLIGTHFIPWNEHANFGLSYKYWHQELSAAEAISTNIGTLCEPVFS